MIDTTSAEPDVLRVLSEILEVPGEELRARPELAAHQWDSMTSLEALCCLERQFSVRLDLQVFNRSRTVWDMVALISASAPQGTG